MLELLALFKRAHKTKTIYQVWEEGSHPQAVMSEAAMRQKIDYIHHNPVARGYVDRPEHWRYSSARNYPGQPGLIEVAGNGEGVMGRKGMNRNRKLELPGKRFPSWSLGTRVKTGARKYARIMADVGCW
uniref:Transposase n=1 Tax=Candidatus Kentrum sp. DK TaxID=2126562 RepID=A0A450RUT8_9GAMM|nr:MAG: hypothetical protein BECKDK2373C_GA0170839_100273 [Candidatus Kentron sp. DK]